jgi:hypothetical protein
LQPFGKLDAEKVVHLLRGHPFVRVKFPGEKMREYAASQDGIVELEK